ncbi:MAG TPA: VWA domain-containing protein [Polyangia bacterium]|nr:VWA domain-containing protein [Polyangia bacterium]
MRILAFAFAVLSFASGRASAEKVPLSAGPAATSTQKIAVDARGPVALVEVTRTVTSLQSPPGSHGSEAVLDFALPDGSALVALEVRDGGRWRSVDPAAESAHAADVYKTESSARGLTPVSEPFEDGATHRLRLLRGPALGAQPVTVRYRFAILPVANNGRLLVRFPAAPERLPPAAEVKLQLRDAADAEIAGVRTDLPPGAGTATGRATTRGAWEVAWTPRSPKGKTREVAPLEARVALAALSPTETALALLARHGAAEKLDPPGSVLFLVDRSRSIGLPGLSAERDLVRAIIEALPPSTRFDALFFDRRIKRLFPMSRPATREAIESFENEMVPDRLQNGTDLLVALREAGALLRRETATFGPRAMLVLVTDGALGAAADAPGLDKALGAIPGLDLWLAALTIRPVDDEPLGPRARDLLRALAASRGGVARELRANQIGDAVPALIADLERGGDLGAIRVVAGETDKRLAASLAPGDALAGVLALKGPPPRTVRIEGLARGRAVPVVAHPQRLQPEWLRPWIEPPPSQTTRFFEAPSLVALLERGGFVEASDSGTMVQGSMDRMVVRNMLSLAYMPRARACYLNRTAATPALRDLSGKVRLAIDLSRGEVDRATIEASTLGNPDIERCLTESAFEIEVPRAFHNDAPVTAVLNMNFRPRTPDKKADGDLGAVGDQIDLVIEEMRRREAEASPAPPH